MSDNGDKEIFYCLDCSAAKRVCRVILTINGKCPNCGSEQVVSEHAFRNSLLLGLYQARKSQSVQASASQPNGLRLHSEKIYPEKLGDTFAFLAKYHRELYDWWDGFYVRYHDDWLIPDETTSGGEIVNRILVELERRDGQRRWLAIPIQPEICSEVIFNSERLNSSNASGG